MKTRFLQIAFALSAIYLIFASYSGGPGAVGSFDRTGSFHSSGFTCTQCHGGSSANTIVVTRILDGGGNPISSYIPEQVYTLEVQVSNASFSFFGSQAVVLTAGNANAGTLNTSPITANTQVSTVSGRSYLEHNSRSPTGLFQTQWTAPSAGTGTVTVYSVGNAVNANGTTTGDQPSSPTTLVITEAVATSIAYSQSSYCQDGTDPTPTITGTTGGSFSSTGGLSINSSTGAIDLSASTPNSYLITYTYGAGSTTTFNITVTARDVATIDYGVISSFCSNASSNPTPAISGTTGGSFSSTAGLNINSSTGVVNLAASTPGSYTVTYTTSGICPTTTTAPITVLQSDVASFTYGGASFCQSGSNPTPTIGGTTGGVFSSTAGLVINSSTGEIDVNASTIGSYSVTYTTAGTCPDDNSITINITAAGSADFNYAAASFCSDATSPLATITGAGGGTFTSSPSGLSINSSTGSIDLSATTAGSYMVYYTVAGSCPAMDSATVTVNAADNASIGYAQSTYCGFDTDPAANITGTTGGTFSATPSGMIINGSTGLIDLDASAANTYSISYITAGICPDTATTTVIVDQCSGISSFAGGAITLYPNPTSNGTFNLKNGGNATETNVSVYSASGQLILSENFYFEANSIRNSSLPADLPKGLYMIKIQQEDKVKTISLLYQ